MRVFRKFTFTFVVESLRERFPRRRTRRMLAAVFALLLCAGAAQAQTPVKLVGNTGQTANTTATTTRFINDRAQAFTTGGNPTGYTLRRVDLPMSYNGITNPTAPDYTVKIHNATSSGPGTTVLGTLTNPASVADGANSYTTTGIELEPNTTYFVVIDVTGQLGNHHRISNDITNSDNEDAGKAAGWSIANVTFDRQFDTSGGWSQRTYSWKMAIRGVVNRSAPPAAPAEPTVSGTDGTSLTVTWTAPAGPVTDYDVRYRRKGDAAWTEHAHDGTAITATITGLLQGASWEAQVAAGNAVGPGRWSATGSGHTGPARFVRAETNAAGTGIFVYLTKFPKSGLLGVGSAYTLTRNGVSSPSVSASSDSDRILTLGTGLANVVQAGQTVTVSYAKPSGSKLQDADGLEVANFGPKTVSNRVALAAPGTPTVSAGTNSGSLSASWTAPAGTVTNYDLRYYAGSADPDDESDWVTEGAPGLPDPGASTSATITGLLASTAYRVQARARNADGEGPWSASGTATTGTVPAANNAPRAIRSVSGANACAVITNASTPASVTDAPADTAVSARALVQRGTETTEWPASCTRTVNRTAPIFDDRDAEQLSITMDYTLPDNVRVDAGMPSLSQPTLPSGSEGGRVSFRGFAAFRTTDVRVDLTATDPDGASASTHLIFQPNPAPDRGNVPSFVSAASGRSFKANEAIDPFVLPAATGGDVTSSSNTFLPTPYFYAVSGLPAGLEFDAETRTISGTPTEPGIYTVTYTAEDADDRASADRNPVTVDSSDTASRTFRVQVGNPPKIDLVRIVSKPTYDSDGDGVNDTYVRGDNILIDVEFNAPVKVTGAHSGLRLRLDLGTDDANLGNSRKVLSLDSVRHNDQTLRFAHRVLASDRDTQDGVWVQTVTVNGVPGTVLFTPETPGPKTTVTHADTGEDAVLTANWLPTSGNPLAKVDGSKQTNDIGPITSDTGVEVNGATLKLVFAAGLAAPSDLDALRFDFQVRGAGGIGADDRTHSQSPTAIVHRAVAKGDSFGGLELTLGTPARAGDTVTVSYTGTTLKGPGASGKRAPMFRGLAVTNNTPGTSGPAPLRATLAGTTLRVVFNAALDTTSTPPGSAFTVVADDPDGDSRAIAGTGTASIEGSVVTVTLDAAMRADEQGNVSYEKPASSPLQGTASGNPAVRSFERFRVRAVTEGVAPKLLGGAVGQTGTTPAQSKLALYFDEALDTFSVPAAGDFAVRTGENAVTVSAVAVEGNAVALTLNRAAAAGTVFEVTWTPGTQRIRDRAGNEAAGFRQTVSAASGKPALTSVTADGAKVVLTWDKPVDPAFAPAADAFIFHLELLTTGGLNQQIGGTPDDPNDPNDSDTSPDTLTIGVTGIAVSGRTAVIHLDDPVLPCAAAFELTYEKPAASPFRGLDGTEADGFASQTVTNGRAYRCDNSNWVQGARVGSVILRGKRPFATDVAPQASWFTVAASGGPVTVTGAAFSADDPYELKLSLSRDFAPGETVTVSYRRPLGEPGLWDADGNQLGDIVNVAVSNGAREGPPALTAAFAGLPGAHDGTGAFRFELVFSEDFPGRLDYRVLRDRAFQVGNGRVTGARRAAQGQNRRWIVTVEPASSGDVTLTLTAGSVTTQAGRSLSNTLTATVQGMTPLTAAFAGLPAEHDGRKLFTFELVFSEDFPGQLDYRVLRDRAFQVGNGRVRGAKRAAPGQNRRWTISVRPSSHGDVTLTLTAGSVTTQAGRSLSNTVTATVIGPALLSVADAEAREGPDAAVEFTVSLSRAASDEVTVDYMTRDGTATAGEDYTRTRGTLTFAAGETRKTVSVPILDDVHDEGRETFTLKLTGARGAAIEDGEATGTIINSDEMPRAWLARFGRAAAEHVVDAIGGRFGASPGTQMTLGGQALDFSADPDPDSRNALLSGAGTGLAQGGPLLTGANGFARGLNERTGEDAEAPRRELSMPDLLLNSSFHLASADGADVGASGRWSVWGRAARSSFEGVEGALRVEGDVTTATLGFDYERGRWLAGVALSRSSGDGSYEKAGMRGEVESVLTGVYPYARYSVSERLSVWGVVGHGQGDMTLEPQGATSAETDIETTMAAGGARGVLLPARAAGGFELALRADLLAVETSSDSASNLVASEVGTSRLRLLIEASRSFRVGAAGALAASAEAGLRYDGGDAETGSGLEVGGSLRWTSGSLTIEVAARGLMAHSEDDYEEWGVSGSVRYAQAPDGRGFSLRAGSAWGAAAGGAERIWSQAPGGFRAGGAAPGAGVDAEAGYGFGFRGGLLTPYTGVALSDSGDTWRAGARWKLGPAFELALEASLRENAGGDAPESGVLLKGSRRW